MRTEKELRIKLGLYRMTLVNEEIEYNIMINEGLDTWEKEKEIERVKLKIRMLEWVLNEKI